MKNFEYKTEYFSGYSYLDNWLNDQGKEGWELVSVKYYNSGCQDKEGIYTFKREILVKKFEYKLQ